MAYHHAPCAHICRQAHLSFPIPALALPPEQPSPTHNATHLRCQLHIWSQQAQRLPHCQLDRIAAAALACLAACQPRIWASCLGNGKQPQQQLLQHCRLRTRPVCPQQGTSSRGQQTNASNVYIQMHQVHLPKYMCMCSVEDILAMRRLGRKPPKFILQSGGASAASVSFSTARISHTERACCCLSSHLLQE